MPHITRPTLLLDRSKCLRNIERMVQKANKHNLHLRPHFKTHQSPQVGEWFREAGITHITVSSLAMAGAFAQHGWQNILVAVPANQLEVEAINSLAQQVRLELLLAQPEVVRSLSAKLTQPMGFFIEIDTGYHRTGIPADRPDKVRELLESVSSNLQFRGFYTHAGHSYQAREEQALATIHRENLRQLRSLKKLFSPDYPSLQIVTGDTPTISALDHFEGVDAISPGNFVFYDYMQTLIGSCTTDEVAVAMACPVIAVYPERRETVIYGGAVHFSKDFIEGDGGRRSFGQMVEWEGERWGSPIPGCYLKEISQEHGKVKLEGEWVEKVQPGDVLCFLPIHSCLTANLMGRYLTLEGEEIRRIVY